MRTKRLLAMAAMAALFSGMLSLSAAPAGALSGDESQFVSSHNSIRASNGLRSLSVATDLVTVARRHADRMAAAGSIWHNPNLTSEVRNWQVVGENVGMGPGVADLMDAFMNSPGHRSNILDREYNQFGVGVTIADGTIFVTVVFAKRSTTTSVSSPTRPRTTTTRPKATTTTSRPKPAAAAAPRKAAPAARPSAPPVRTVSMLVRMTALDD